MPGIVKIRSAHEKTFLVYICPLCKRRGGAYRFEGDAKAQKNIMCHMNVSHRAWLLKNRKRLRF